MRPIHIAVALSFVFGAGVVLSQSLSGTPAAPVAAAAPAVTAPSDASKIASADRTDWKALRFRKSTDSDSFDFAQAEKVMFSALHKQDFQKALVDADTILKHNYANGNAHYVALVAADKLGQKARADSEQAKVIGLVHSIEDGRNGKSADTAWVTANVDEEYFVLHMLGFDPKSQALVMQAGKAFDEMTVSDSHDPDHEYTLWFDTTYSMNAMADAISGKK